MSRIHTLTQRSIAFALAAVVTLAVLSSIDGLATRGVATNALLSQQSSPAQQA
jgi:hypothetical protein